MGDLEEECLRDAFTSFFKPTIRVLFNWRRMEEAGWPVELTVLKKPVEFSHWFLPWYTGPHGTEVGYSAPDATPVALSHFPGTLTKLDERRQRLIRQLQTSFASSRPPIQLCVPRYSLGSKGYLLLDNSHRMAALASSNLPFVIMAFTVLGPLDNRVLPDLCHWKDVD